jgi:hypothetical protein
MRIRILGEVARVHARTTLFRILSACWIGRPPSDSRLFALATAFISVLGWERETRVIQTWNPGTSREP